ncbi:MAG: 3-oxoadipate enol-lactonase [Rhodospirillales bacterium]|nr:3-oxoadipate enol-lactonase [Rhodospirillales bacterium]
MHFVGLNGTTIRYRISGDPRGPAVVFANALGTDLTIWDDVTARLPAGYATIGYDKRGHGLSGLPAGLLTLEDHASDLLALVHHLGLEDFAICGLSLGGMIAQSVAAHAPEKVRGLVLCNTGAKIGPPEIWNDRIAAIEAGGLAPLADAAMERWFTPAFHVAKPAALAGYRAMLLNNLAAGYAASCAAIRDGDLTESTSRLKLPALCIAGAEDLATPPATVNALSDLIEGAHYREIPACGHISPVEQPEICARLIADFLGALEDESVPAERGMAVRRKVLGDAHVDRARAQATALDRRFQSFIAEGAWGNLWAGRGWSLRERSLVTLALLAAGGQDEEVAMHLRATANTGATEDDVAEALMHVAVYAGVPRANRAFKIAKRVFADSSEET